MMRQIRRQKNRRNNACRKHAESVLCDLFIANKIKPNTDQNAARGIQRGV
jgi:hypothetical protein